MAQLGRQPPDEVRATIIVGVVFAIAAAILVWVVGCKSMEDVGRGLTPDEVQLGFSTGWGVNEGRIDADTQRYTGWVAPTWYIGPRQVETFNSAARDAKLAAHNHIEDDGGGGTPWWRTTGGVVGVLAAASALLGGGEALRRKASNGP